FPSAEIGARRVTALAQFLALHGMRVVVVSAFGGQEIESEKEIMPGVIAVPVPLPKWTLRALLVSLKRLARANKVVTLPGAAISSDEGEGSGLLGRLRIG